MLARLVQPSNASSPMVVTLSGMVMLSRLVQSLNAESSMVSPLVKMTVCKEDFEIELIALVGIVDIRFAHI